MSDYNDSPSSFNHGITGTLSSRADDDTDSAAEHAVTPPTQLMWASELPFVDSRLGRKMASYPPHRRSSKQQAGARAKLFSFCWC